MIDINKVHTPHSSCGVKSQVSWSFLCNFIDRLEGLSLNTLDIGILLWFPFLYDLHPAHHCHGLFLGIMLPCLGLHDPCNLSHHPKMVSILHVILPLPVVDSIPNPGKGPCGNSF